MSNLKPTPQALAFKPAGELKPGDTAYVPPGQGVEILEARLEDGIVGVWLATGEHVEYEPTDLVAIV